MNMTELKKEIARAREIAREIRLLEEEIELRRLALDILEAADRF